MTLASSWMIETWVERAEAQVGRAAIAARQRIRATGKRLFIRIGREGCLHEAASCPPAASVNNCLAPSGLRCLAPGHRWYLTLVTNLREGKTMGIGTSIFLIALG